MICIMIQPKPRVYNLCFVIHKYFKPILKFVSIILYYKLNFNILILTVKYIKYCMYMTQPKPSLQFVFSYVKI